MLAEQRTVVVVPPVVAQHDQPRAEARRRGDRRDLLLVGEVLGRPGVAAHLDAEGVADQRARLEHRLRADRVEQLARRVALGPHHGADGVVGGLLGGFLVVRLGLQADVLVDVGELLVDELALAQRAVEHLEAEPEVGVGDHLVGLLRVQHQLAELVAERPDPANPA